MIEVVIDERFVLLSFVFSIFGTFTYIKGILEGRVKPNKITWLLWGLIPLIAFFAQISAGVTWPAVMTFTSGFFPLVIFAISFKSKGSKWKISKLDIICASISILGIILWLNTQDPISAIIFSIIADGFAGIPTITKAFFKPETEDLWGFVFPLLGAVVTLLTLTDWSLAYSAFPLYILGITSLLVILIKFKLGKLLLR